MFFFRSQIKKTNTFFVQKKKIFLRGKGLVGLIMEQKSNAKEMIESVPNIYIFIYLYITIKIVYL